MFINHSPFPGISFDHFDVHRGLHTTTLVRGRFRFHATMRVDEWVLRPDPDQGGLRAADVYYDDDLKQAVRYESDYAPYKAVSDVIFNGYSHAPDNRPQEQWRCGLKVVRDNETLFRKILQVNGPRDWIRAESKGWRLTEAQAVNKVLLRASNAYGGDYQDDTPDTPETERWQICHPENPVGCGFLHEKDRAQQRRAPQIEYPDDPVNSTDGDHQPAGFGWVLRTGASRIHKAGTYDAAWLENRHPFSPQDFTDAYYQGAPEDQQIRSYLQGNEKIRLVCLLPGVRLQNITLPGYQLFCRSRTEKQQDRFDVMQLDTLVIDTESEDFNDWRVSMTWRIRTVAARTEIEVLLIVPDEHKATAGQVGMDLEGVPYGR